MDIQSVVQEFAQFSGLDAQEAQQWLSICRSAVESIEEATEPKYNTAENAQRFIMAAAAVAFFRYSLITATQQVHDLKVGDVQISGIKSGLMPTATRIKDEFLEAIGDCMKNKTGLTFKEVAYGAR